MRDGFASIAHIPALKALPEFETTAVCTTRQDSAEAAARHYRVPMAFCDAKKLRFFADGAAKKWPLRGSLRQQRVCNLSR